MTLERELFGYEKRPSMIFFLSFFFVTFFLALSLLAHDWLVVGLLVDVAGGGWLFGM